MTELYTSLENCPAALREFQDFPEIRDAQVLDRSYDITSPFEWKFSFDSVFLAELSFPYTETM